MSTLNTGEELAFKPGIGSCELIAGRIVLMSPTGDEHGRVEGNAFRILDAFVRVERLGHVRVGDVGIYTRRDPDSVRAADVLFISNQRYARRSSASAFLDMAPALVVEILSPRDAVIDLAEKIREYFAIGVKLEGPCRAGRSSADRWGGDTDDPGACVPGACCRVHVATPRWTRLGGTGMRWKIGEAKRLRMIGSSSRTIGAAFEGLRALAKREGYRLTARARTTRRNTFADGLDRVSR